MLERIKTEIQNKLYNRCYKKYAEEVERQKDRYAQFLKTRTELLPKGGKAARPAAGDKAAKTHAVYNAPGPDAGDDGREKDILWRVVRTPELVMLARDNGAVEEAAVECFRREFEAKPYRQLSYAHEDCLSESGRRHTPWFKPEWSPDTLEGQLYFGDLFAFRAELAEGLAKRGLVWKDGMSTKEAAGAALLAGELLETEYGPVRADAQDKPAGPLDKILFHRFAREEGAESYFIPMPLTREEARKDCTMRSAGRVSVIIPSKDNPEALEICVRSIREKTAGVSYDLTVVDNGSGTENKERLEGLASRYDFSYLYRPMEFNFSAMCNLGAAFSHGEFLLFLNDDVEVLQEDWLAALLKQAGKRRAGAVGAKLLYPGTDLIQHAGVTNLRVGPAHKILKCPDKNVYYHGGNRDAHDMLAVTAACLLVERNKFERAGGFCEDIKVSYNDVDLCFSLYELGLYNIQCNGVTLYHHESLSRGDDNLSEEKWKRLLLEKDALYGRHPALYNRDPFYSPYLAEHFSDYLCNYEYAYERRDIDTPVKPYRKPEPVQWANECLTVNVEHARKDRRLELHEEKDAYWIEGWSYVLGMDNCRYRRSLLLLHESGRIYEAAVLDRYRKDVEDILPEQTNTALAGFFCRIPKDKLPAGSWRIAMLAKDACSSQKLYRQTETFLTAD